MLARILIGVLAVACLPAVALGQIRVDPSTPDGKKAVEAFDALWAKPDGTTLACRVQPIPSRMGMSFRVFSGFQTTLELAQMPARRTRLALVFRVKAKNGKNAAPVYFWEGLEIPEAAKRPARPTAFLSGGFYLGPGAYEVQWLMSDDQDRMCRSTWTVDTKRVRAGQTALKAGAIEPLGMENWRGAEARQSGPTATIFLNAAPLWRNRYFTRLSSWDRSLLLGSLTALLDLGGFKSTRVVAYDVPGRRVLFDEKTFSRAAYGKLAQSLREANFGLVDYGVLKDGPSEGQFLAKMVGDDRKIEKPTDMVIFLGPELLQGVRRLPPEMERVTEDLRRSFYLALAREPVPQGDLISKLVKAAGGKMFLVTNGGDLIKPIRALAEAPKPVPDAAKPVPDAAKPAGGSAKAPADAAKPPLASPVN